MRSKVKKCAVCKGIIEDDFIWSKICRDCYEVKRSASVSCVKCDTVLPLKMMKNVVFLFKIGRREAKKYNVMYCSTCFQLVMKKVSSISSKQSNEVERAFSEYKKSRNKE